MPESSAKQHLDRDIAIEIVVVSFPYLTHSSFSDQLEQAVAAKTQAGSQVLGSAGILGHASKASSNYLRRTMRKNTLWNPDARKELSDRVQRLDQAATPKWGRMSAPQMLAHLTNWMKMATGEIATAPKNLPLRFSPVKQLAIYVLPFPKGVPTAVELITREPDEWSAERSVFLKYLDEFESMHRGKSFPYHPAFGILTDEAWGVLGYRHTDHHLTQFGV
jgi:hypothetical protein